MMIDHSALVLINENSQILFIQRSFQKKSLPGIWSFPSGTLENNESPEQTAIRESKEELGVEIKTKGILAVHELPELSVRLHFVLSEIIMGTPQILQPQEIERIEWFTFQEFFDKFNDSQIGHGLIWLRQHQEILKNI